MPVLQSLSTSLTRATQGIRDENVVALRSQQPVRCAEIFDSSDEGEEDDIFACADFGISPFDCDPIASVGGSTYRKPSAAEPMQTSLCELMLRGKHHSAEPIPFPPSQLPPTKLPAPPVVADGALHRACLNACVTPSEIEYLIRQDPAAVTRSIKLTSYKKVYSPILKKTVTKLVMEKYSYPLNLALQARACNQVLEFLVDAGPQVLSMPDGSLQETPISVFLRYHPSNTVLFDKLLLGCPSSAYARDRQDNTLAHVAAREGAHVDMVKHIAILNPDSLRQRNFHGHTPLELAQQRTSMGNDAVATFLMNKQNDPLYRC
jgi:hypothetical protein